MDDQLDISKLENLVKANLVRLERAEDKRRIRRGELDPVQILRLLPNHWSSAKLSELLLTIPRVGQVRALEWLAIHNHELSDRLSSLTVRDRELLARTVDTWRRKRLALDEQIKRSAA